MPAPQGHWLAPILSGAGRGLLQASAGGIPWGQRAPSMLGAMGLGIDEAVQADQKRRQQLALLEEERAREAARLKQQQSNFDVNLKLKQTQHKDLVADRAAGRELEGERMRLLDEDRDAQRALMSGQIGSANRRHAENLAFKREQLAETKRQNKLKGELKLRGRQAFGRFLADKMTGDRKDPLAMKAAMRVDAGGSIDKAVDGYFEGDKKRKAAHNANLAALELASSKRDRSMSKLADIERYARMPGTTGLPGWALRFIPGTNAFELGALTDTLKAEAGFEELMKMKTDPRNKTGGALGQVTERELQLLQSVIGNFNPDMKEEQFLSQLKRYQVAVNQSWGRIQEAMQRDIDSGFYGPDAALPTMGGATMPAGSNVQISGRVVRKY